jgi:hypothetical protein
MTNPPVPATPLDVEACAGLLAELANNPDFYHLHPRAVASLDNLRHFLLAALPGMGKDSERTRGVYVASRSKHGATWRRWRDDGFPIASTWIDESGEGETSDWSDLWSRCVNEARTADACVLYAPLDDGELKGALIEVGGALAAGRPVYFVGDGTARRYSWLAHPNVVQCDEIEEAFALALLHTRAIDAARAAQPEETSADA